MGGREKKVWRAPRGITPALKNVFSSPSNEETGVLGKGFQKKETVGRVAIPLTIYRSYLLEKKAHFQEGLRKQSEGRKSEWGERAHAAIWGRYSVCLPF